jgi:cell shape-determining protein MreC
MAQLLKQKQLRDNRKAAKRELVKFAGLVDSRLKDDTIKVPARVVRYVRAVEKGVTDRARRTPRHKALTALLDQYFTKKTTTKRTAGTAA